MNPSEPQAPAPPADRRPRRWRRVLAAVALLVGGGVIGAVVTSPTLGQGWYGGPYGWHRGYDDGPGWRGRDFGPRSWRDDGPGWRGRDSGPRGWHEDRPRMHRGMGFGRLERGVDWALWSVDATREQREKVTSILDRTVDDLLELRAKHRESHAQIRDALAAATIDRGRIEALRGEQMQLADAASKRIADALAEAAEALTPEQRSRLARRIERWQRWFRG